MQWRRQGVEIYLHLNMENTIAGNFISLPKLYFLALYQLIGGVLGIILTIFLILRLTEVSVSLFLLLAIALSLYCYSVLCGILLFKNPLLGIKYSRINQYLQIFGFFIFGYGFRYVAGFFITIGLNLTNSINFVADLGTSAWQINIDQESKACIISFNFVALFLILFLDRQLKIIKQNIFSKEISQLGEGVQKAYS